MAKIITIFFFFLTFSISFGQNENDISKYFEEDKDRIVATKNILKINYLRAALNGNAVISYERYLTPLLSVEAELGITYWDLTSNFIIGVFYDDLDIDGRYKIGYSTGIGLRIYPKKDEMNGFYIHPHYRYVRYNFATNSPNNFETFQRYHYHDALANVGYQILYGKVSLDYYTGVGVRMLQVREQSDINNVLVSNQSNKLIPHLSFGFRFGYIF